MYARLTQQEALDCPGPLCKGTVTASPGEQIDFWIAGTNLARVTGIQFSPSDGVSVSQVQATNTTVRAVLTISTSASLGQRSFVVTSPSGDSNESPGRLNISTFRISNLRIDNIANSGNTLTFTVTIDYTDPTGAVSSEPLGISTTLAFGNTIMASIGFGFNFNPSGRTPGATSGVMTYTETYNNVRGTTGAHFKIRLNTRDGRESDWLGRNF